MTSLKRRPSKKRVHKKKMRKEIKKSTIMGDIFNSVLLCTFVAFIIFSLILGVYIYKRNINYSLRMLEEENKNISTKTEHLFRDISSLVDMLSYNPALTTASESLVARKELSKIFIDIQRNKTSVNKLFVGYENDSLIFAENYADKNFKEDKWYKDGTLLNKGQYSVNFTSLQQGDSTRFIMSKSVFSQDALVGVVGVDCRLDSLYSWLETRSMYKSKELILVNEKYQALITPDPKQLHLNIVNGHRDIFYNQKLHLQHEEFPKKYLIQSHKLNEENWYLISLVDYKEVIGPIIPRLAIFLGIMLIVSLIISKVYALVLGRIIARPVIEVSSALHKLAKGNLNVSAIQKYPKNEIGTMAKSFNSFLETIQILKADINELQETKADLSYSLSLLNASLESTDDGIMIINNNGLINKWNSRFLDIWDIDEKDLAIRNDARHFPNIKDKIVNTEQFFAIIEQANENPQMPTFDMIEFKNGSFVERYSFPQEVEGEIVGRVWRYRDITELKKSEIQLRDSEEKHRVMFTQTVDAYCIMEDGVFVDVNEAATSILGSPSNWLLGKTPKEISPKYQPDGSLSEEKANKYIQLALQDKKQTFRWIHLRYDGTEFPAEISLIKIRLKAKDRILAIWRDITQEEEMAEKLRTSEENFRLFFESLQDMVFIADLQGNIRYTNKAVVEKLNYQSEELKEMTIIDLHENSEGYELQAVVDYFINTNGNYCPIPLKTKDDKLVPVETQSWVGKWDGQDCLFAVSKDITKEQEALEKFNKIFDSNPSLMALSSYPDRKFLDVNESFCKALGYQKEEVLGKTTTELKLTMEVDKLDLATAKLVGQGNFKNIHMKVIPREGEIIEGLFSGELIESNGNKYFLTVMTDITDIKKLDNKLRESEKKYRLLFENMTTGFANHKMVYDEEGKPIDYIFLDANPAFEEFTGLKAKEVIGKRITEVLPETEKYWIETYGKVAKTRQSLNYENFSGALGKYFEVKAFSSEQDEFAVIFSDSTERVKVLKELEDEKEIAQAATKAKSEFLANMSHEIRTPLNGVIGFTDLLLSTQLSESQKQFAINANTSGKALLGIISDILDFSKIEAGKMELDIVNSSIINILEEAVNIIKFAACKKGLEVILNIPNHFPEKAMVDPLRLKQILVNLLNNAVKFTTKGEIQLSSKFIAQEGQSGRFIFSVKDTGIGITEEDSKRLFKAFSQADGSITRRYGGTGLGLVISNFFAAQMGSHIDFDSTEGEGSEFYFAIDTEYTEVPSTSRNKFKDKKILLLERNSNQLEILNYKMEYWGLEVTAIRSIDDLIKKTSEQNFDIMLLDESLITSNDYELISRIVKDNSQESQSSVIINYCPNDNKDIVSISRKIQANHIMTRPVLYSELLGVLSGITSEEKEIESKLTTSEVLFESIQSVKRKTVLVAEDVEMNMILITTLVKKLVKDVDIKQAKNGMEAVHIFKQECPDLVLMDVQMPELDGLEATKAIKRIEKKISSNTPIIALTAGAFSDDKEKCLKAGMVDFLTKPINVKNLASVLKKYLQD